MYTCIIICLIIICVTIHGKGGLGKIYIANCINYTFILHIMYIGVAIATPAIKHLML